MGEKGRGSQTSVTLSMKEGSFSVEVVQFPVKHGSKSNKQLDGCLMSNQCVDLIKVNSRDLREILCNQASFAAHTTLLIIYLEFKYSNQLPSWWRLNQLPDLHLIHQS